MILLYIAAAAALIAVGFITGVGYSLRNYDDTKDADP